MLGTRSRPRLAAKNVPTERPAIVVAYGVLEYLSEGT
jgi:hypothetical protein